jgi:hypothetical protein
MSKFGPSEWMRKAIPVGYFRISDDKQDKSDRGIKDAKDKPTLIDQFNSTNADLKKAGLPQVKKANAFFEVASGTDRDRRKWLDARAKNHDYTLKSKRSFFVVQDPSRFGRNTRHAFRALDEMHDEGVPVYAAREGIQTGSVGDLHPTEELLFVQLMGGASYVSQVQKEKADVSVAKSKEGKGIMAGKGTSLFPFARMDPQEAFTSQLALFTLKPKEGGGSSAFKGTVEGMTAPHGPKFSAVAGMMVKDAERRSKLTDKEYDAWLAFRTKIRNILIEREHDPWAKGTKAGDVDFGTRALMRMAGRYLQEPFKYGARDDSEIAEYLDNPREYLSFDDSALWKSVVGHR